MLLALNALGLNIAVPFKPYQLFVGGYSSTSGTRSAVYVFIRSKAFVCWGNIHTAGKHHLFVGVVVCGVKLDCTSKSNRCYSDIFEQNVHLLCGTQTVGAQLSAQLFSSNALSLNVLTTLTAIYSNLL